MMLHATTALRDVLVPTNAPGKHSVDDSHLYII